LFSREHCPALYIGTRESGSRSNDARIPAMMSHIIMYLVNKTVSFWLCLTTSFSIPPDLSSRSVEELGRLRDALLPLREAYSHCLLVTTAVVTVGVVLEIFETGLDTREHLLHLLNRSEPPKRKSHSWMKLAGTVGWPLIVFGLVGEYVAEARISSADANLEAINDTILTKTQSAANSAQKSADLADAAATSAQGSVRLRPISRLARPLVHPRGHRM
jgi:hypothetical protein